MKILAGDIGGTSARLALFDDERDLEPVESATFESRQYHGLEPIVRLFLGDRCTDVAAAAFGIAGPVEDDTSQATNLPWRVDARRLERELGLGKARLLNDFEAVARGIPSLGDDDVAVLQHGDVDATAPVAIVGAGTGLGEAMLVPGLDGGPTRVIASEGGHTDLAPRNEEEIELLRFLLRRHERVSYERVVSGPGLATLYEFATDGGRHATSPDTAQAIRDGDAAAVISERGMAGEDEAAAAAVRLFVSLYGAEAGNLALKCLPFGGVFLAGGIAPKMLDALRGEDRFVRAFTAKGRMSPLLEKMRVAVIVNTRVGLLGARNLAASL